MSLSENLQFLRARQGLTQEQLAEQLEVSRQSVSKWESGASYPEMDTLLKLCGIFHTDLDTLLRGSVEQSFGEDAAGYDRFMTSFARKVAGAVSAIIAGAALACLGNLSGTERGQMLFGAAFLLILTVSVVVLIASGMEADNFQKRNPCIRDFYSQAEKDAFDRKFIWYIAGGVGAILFSLVLLCLAFAVLPEEEPFESAAAAAFLLVVAASVFFLVYGGMQKNKYDIASYNAESDTSPQAQLRKAICGAIMLAATCVFLALPILTGDEGLWHASWVAFPIGGILCGIVSRLMNAMQGRKKGE